MHPLRGHFQVGADHRGRRGLAALGAGAELPPRPPDVTRYTTPLHPSLCNSALPRLPIAPVTFAGREGRPSPPNLGWGSPPRRDVVSHPRGGPALPGPSRQFPERARQEAGGRSGSPSSHPSRARAASGPGARSSAPHARARPSARPRPREPRARAPLPAPRHSGLPGRSPL